MSNVRDRLKAANEVESPDDRIAAALSRLPLAGQCKFIDEDGVMCQRRRSRGAWCENCRMRVIALPKAH
jgi:hypothetical protein